MNARTRPFSLKLDISAINDDESDPEPDTPSPVPVTPAPSVGSSVKRDSPHTGSDRTGSVYASPSKRGMREDGSSHATKMEPAEGIPVREFPFIDDLSTAWGWSDTMIQERIQFSFGDLTHEDTYQDNIYVWRMVVFLIFKLVHRSIGAGPEGRLQYPSFARAYGERFSDNPDTKAPWYLRKIASGGNNALIVIKEGAEQKLLRFHGLWGYAHPLHKWFGIFQEIPPLKESKLQQMFLKNPLEKVGEKTYFNRIMDGLDFWLNSDQPVVLGLFLLDTLWNMYHPFSPQAPEHTARLPGEILPHLLTPRRDRHFYWQADLLHQDLVEKYPYLKGEQEHSTDDREAWDILRIMELPMLDQNLEQIARTSLINLVESGDYASVAPLFHLLIPALWILGVFNLSGYYHNDMKVNNLMTITRTGTTHYRFGKNQMTVDYALIGRAPLLIDFDNLIIAEGSDQICLDPQLLLSDLQGKIESWIGLRREADTIPGLDSEVGQRMGRFLTARIDELLDCFMAVYTPTKAQMGAFDFPALRVKDHYYYGEMRAVTLHQYRISPGGENHPTLQSLELLGEDPLNADRYQIWFPIRFQLQELLNRWKMEDSVWRGAGAEIGAPFTLEPWATTGGGRTPYQEYQFQKAQYLALKNSQDQV